MNFIKNKYFEEELRNFAKQKTLSENNWYNISWFQILSEDFIQKFQNDVDWAGISARQNLSEKFIQKFKNKIDWYWLTYNKKIEISDEFTIEFDEKLGSNNYWIINSQFHRILGPAKIFHNGKKEYWYRGKHINVNSDEEYFEWLKYKNF